MEKIIWGIIGIWSLLVCIDVIVDWLKWKPTEDTLRGNIVAIEKYRAKMLIKMIIPVILAMMGAVVVLA